MSANNQLLEQAEQKSLKQHGTEENWVEFVAKEQRDEMRFCQSIKRTIAEFFFENSQAIRKHESNWQASAWLLERRDPENYGRKDRMPWIDPDSGGGIVPVVIYMPDNQRGPKKEGA
jgi:hypothetical protein